MAFPLAAQIALGQPGSGGRQSVEIEHCANIGAFRTVADRAAIGAVAQRQANGVDQNGFARAGFARHGSHPCRQFQIQRLDNGEVADAQLCQHGSDKR